ALVDCRQPIVGTPGPTAYLRQQPEVVRQSQPGTAGFECCDRLTQAGDRCRPGLLTGQSVADQNCRPCLVIGRFVLGRECQCLLGPRFGASLVCRQLLQHCQVGCRQRLTEGLVQIMGQLHSLVSAKERRVLVTQQP